MRRRTLPLLLALLSLPGLLLACGGRRGGGGGGGNSDDDDDASGPISFAPSYAYTMSSQIEPTKFGMSLGLTSCSAFLSYSLSQDADSEPCADCVAVWSGALTGSSSGCGGFEAEPSMELSLGLGASGLAMWSWSDDPPSWEHLGDAESSDGGWSLHTVEPMGEGEFSMGTITTDHRLE